MDNKTAKYYIETILIEGSDRLTDWEKTFIDSISQRVDAGYSLSSKQEDILLRLYEKVTK